MTAGMIIIGAGETGVRAAGTLRRHGYTGAITLLGKEMPGLYERPPLSKQYLTGEVEAPAAIGGAAELTELDVDFRPGIEAEAISLPEKRVFTLGGEHLSYDKLLIATGAEARNLSIPGVPDGAILTLRTLADTDAIRQRVRVGLNVVIVGGGFIGLELASSLRGQGAAVHVLEAQDRLLKRAVPGSLADIVQQEHEFRGVHIHLSARIAEATTESAHHTLFLEDGTRIGADLIIAGIGARPNTALAEQAGLVIDNGIAVNARMQTSNPDVFAAGDCCSFPYGLYGDNRVRLESWRCAQEQGEVAAHNMLGETLAYNKVPWFWTDQFDLGLQIAGLPGFAGHTVTRELGDRARLLFHLDNTGRLLAASGVAPGNGIARDIKICERLIERGMAPDPTVLADPTEKLKPLLKQ